MENISPNLKVNVGQNRRNPDLQLELTHREVVINNVLMELFQEV